MEKLANKLLELAKENAECLSTSELVDILKEREGVTSIQVEIDSRVKLDEEGPVTILRVID